MYEVTYYVLGITKNERKVGNIKQHSDIWYTDKNTKDIEESLIEILDKKNYFPVITNIKKIKGHI